MPTPSRRLTDEDVAIIKALLGQKVAQHDIASFMGVHPTLVSDINCGRRHKDIPPASLSDAAVMRRMIEGLASWNARVSRVVHEAFSSADPPPGRIV